MVDRKTKGREYNPVKKDRFDIRKNLPGSSMMCDWFGDITYMRMLAADSESQESLEPTYEPWTHEYWRTRSRASLEVDLESIEKDIQRLVSGHYTGMTQEIRDRTATWAKMVCKKIRQRIEEES